MKYAILDFPLESIHSSAFSGAEMVRCAGEQNKYWEMRDRLFGSPASLAQSAAAHASAVGMNAKQFDACLTSQKFAADIRKDMSQAEAAGVQGTPSFFIAVNDAATGKLKPVKFLTGAQPFANFKTQIDAALAGQ